jgi:hypothetical protein
MRRMRSKAGQKYLGNLEKMVFNRFVWNTQQVQKGIHSFLSVHNTLDFGGRPCTWLFLFPQYKGVYSTSSGDLGVAT